MARKHEQLQQLLQPVVESMGYVFWGLEYLQGRGAVVRVYIDHEQGITVDDCAAVSHQLSGVLDVEDPVSGEYNLEISSPGVDRPLFTPEQVAAYAGEKIQLRLVAPLDGRRKLTALIKGVEGENLLLEHEGEQRVIAFTQVDKASLVAQLD